MSRNILNEKRIVKGGDAINITDVNSLLPTINLDISKQNANTSIADTDLFVLEDASGNIKKITGQHLKSGSDTTYTVQAPLLLTGTDISINGLSGFTADKFLKVNSAGNAIEYADDNDTTYTVQAPLLLTGTDISINGLNGFTANKFLKVNSAGNAIEYTDNPDTNFWTYSNNSIYPDNITDNVLIGTTNTAIDRKLFVNGTSEFVGQMYVKGIGSSVGYINFYDSNNSHHTTLQPQEDITANIELPSTDTILVGRNTTDTLTNKTITSFTGNSSSSITTPSTTGTLALQSEIFWEKALGAIRPKTQSDKLQLFSSIRNDSTAQSTFLDLLTFKNTTTSSALATFKYQINDTSTNTTSNAKFKMVHYDDNTDTTTDIYSIDTSSILTFSKRLTLTNGLKQGSYDYTMPSASGTLALQSELDDIWTRSSSNIQQTNTNDTLTLDYQADATYKDTLLIKNTNSGTDILTYKFQIKDNGSLDAKLNFKVDYDRGGGTSIDIFDISYDGFLQVKKRLDVANGFYANSGEEYNFPATGGTMVLEALSQNLSNKTFTDATLFEQGIYTKYDGATTVSGFVRFFEATGQGNNSIDLHIENHSLASSLNMFLPNSKNNTVLVGRDTTDTLENKTLKLPKIFDTSDNHSYIFDVNELTANRTILLPLLTGNDTFVFKDHTETLSNKTLKLPKILDTSDNHSYIFDVNELTANRTILLPLLTGNDTFVFKDHAETLSNKTITSFTGNSSASITTPSSSGTLALDDTAHTSKWTDTSNKYAPTNTSLESIDLPTGCKIRRLEDANDWFEFNLFYLLFWFNDIRFKNNSKLTNADFDDQYIQMNNRSTNIISNFIMVKEDCKIIWQPYEDATQYFQIKDGYIEIKNFDFKFIPDFSNATSGDLIKWDEFGGGSNGLVWFGTNSTGNYDGWDSGIRGRQFVKIVCGATEIFRANQPPSGSASAAFYTNVTTQALGCSSIDNSGIFKSCSDGSNALIAFERSGDYLYMNCPAHTSTSGSLDEEGILSYHKNGTVLYFNTSSDYLSGISNYFSFAVRNDQQARITMNGVAQISDYWVDNSDPSDKRLKYDIKDYENATQIINKIKIKSFMKYRVKNFNNDKDDKMLPFKERLGDANYSIGVIAQEIMDIPELKFIVKNSDFNDIEPAYIPDWKPIIALLVKSSQEQQEQKNKMKKEIDDLKKDLVEMKTIINKLVSSKTFKEFKST